MYACVSVFNLIKICAVLSLWDCLCMHVCVCVQPIKICAVLSLWDCLCLHVCVCVQPIKIDAVLSLWDCLCMHVCVSVFNRIKMYTVLS